MPTQPEPETPTPRTDAESRPAMDWALSNITMQVVDADFARQLERELAAATADKDRLDWLEGELAREQAALSTQTEAQIPVSLFRRNQPITRSAIDATRSAQPQTQGREEG